MELLHIYPRWVDSTMEEAKANINLIISHWYWFWWVEQFHNCPRCQKPTLQDTDDCGLCCKICGFTIH